MSLSHLQTAVCEAQAVTICIMKAMEAHFCDWQRSAPLFNYALRSVVTQLEGVAKALYDKELTAAMTLPDVEDAVD